MSPLDEATKEIQDDYVKKANAVQDDYVKKANAVPPTNTVKWTMPKHLEDTVNKSWFAVAFIIAILCGIGIGLGCILRYKLCILVAIMFILLTILAPDISDQLVYGTAKYIDIGYKTLKNFPKVK